jgi:arsenite methyltransferase
MGFRIQEMLIRILAFRSINRDLTVSSDLTLAQALALVDEAFGSDRVLREFDLDITVPYYTQSERGYHIYHSEDDCIHMAINEDGVFNADGYYAQPRFVGQQIPALSAKAVLELGCGKGFNSHYLAQHHPTVQFTGIDLTPLHVAIAQQKSRSLSNVAFQTGDFNALPFPDNQFDIVFAFECLCHATDASRPLAEAYRVLRPGGQLIIFDGYRDMPFDKLSPDLQRAVQLAEVSMAVQNGFMDIQEWSAIATATGFQIILQKNLIEGVYPSLLRLQNLSIHYFRRRRWIRQLAQWLKPYLVRNAIAGLLMPLLFLPQESPISYYQTVLQK